MGGICRVLARRFVADAAVGWEPAVKRACAALKPGEFDLILATACPNVSFRLARWLGRRLACPFVMDYRDPWTGNPHGRRPDILRKSAAEEAVLLRDCAAATVVSPSWAKLIGDTFGVAGKVRVVSNGFEPAMFEAIRPNLFDHFTVVYAGALYPPKRVLDPVLKAFGVFAETPNGRSAKFHYYGDNGQAVREAALRVGTSARVVIHGRVSRQAALAAQKGADLVVVVASVEEKAGLADQGIISGKIFDCLALGRPSLVVAPQGSDLYSIAETAGGMRCFGGNDVAGMTAFISEIASGKAPPRSNPGAYQWGEIAKTLDAVLKACLKPAAFCVPGLWMAFAANAAGAAAFPGDTACVRVGANISSACGLVGFSGTAVNPVAMRHCPSESSVLLSGAGDMPKFPAVGWE